MKVLAIWTLLVAAAVWYADTFGITPTTEITRIEWRYLDPCASCGQLPEAGYAVVDAEGTMFCEDCYAP